MKPIYVRKNGTEKIYKWYGGRRQICHDEFARTGQYRKFDDVLYDQGYHVVDGRKFKKEAQN